MMSALPAGARLAARSGHTKARRLGDEGQVGVLEAELGDLKLGALGHMPLRTQKRKFSAYVYYSSSPSKSPCFRLSRDALPTTKEFDSHGSAAASASGAADESRCDGRPTMEEETQNEPAVEPAVIMMFGGRAHVEQGAAEDEEEGEDEAEDGYEGEDEAAHAVAAAGAAVFLVSGVAPAIYLRERQMVRLPLACICPRGLPRFTDAPASSLLLKS